MKRRMISVCVIFALACAIFMGQAFASSSEQEPYTIDVAYEYPVLPGTDEWVALGSTKNRLSACEIPEDILTHMTTEALVETVVHYPFSSAMYHYETIQEGYNAIRNQFNGLQELERRSDCVEYLAEYNLSICDLSESEKKSEDYVAEKLYLILSSDVDVPTPSYK